MSEKVKNWLIGVLVVIVVIFGINLLSNKPTPTSFPPQETKIPTETSDQNNVTSECIFSQEAWNQIGQEKCVEYYVGNPFRSGKGNIFLNEKRDYKNGFTVWIPSASVSNFSGDPISMYGYKTIQVTGLIRMYQGHPEIIANSQDQITIK